ncbi:MAG: MATE family efflux transporter [Bacteroidetes bacterium]|nr:MATE family efflux transporter [Bacteroidota bacterium]
MFYTEARKTIKLALPIILGELAQMFLHILDAAMVGAVGYKQLAAAALVLSVMNIPFVFGIGITISVSQMVSLANGKKDGKLVSHYLYNGFLLCAFSAVVISLTIELSKNILFHLGQDAEVAALALPYLQIMGWSVIPMLLFMALKQFTDGLEHTKTAMVLSLFSLPLNAFLNWLLIYGNWGFPRLELMGAGWGTLITRSLIFIVLVLIILYHPLFSHYIAVRKKEWRLRWHTIKELLHIGIPSSFQITMEAGAFAVSGIIIGTIGAVEQASHQIALSLASLTFMVSMGLSQAGSIRTSNALGRRDNLSINFIGKSTIAIALVYGTFCALIFILFRHHLPLLFNKNAEVISLSAYLLLFAALFQISDSIQAVTAGLLRGIKDVKIPTYFVAIAYWAIGLPAGCVLAFHFKMGAAGMWTGFIIGLSLSAIFLTLRFKKISGELKQ